MSEQTEPQTPKSEAPPPAAAIVLAGGTTEETANLQKELDAAKRTIKERETRICELEDRHTRSQAEAKPAAAPVPPRSKWTFFDPEA